MGNCPQYSLCTYTYNDGRLADELLRLALAWEWPPAEIVVVDDGSDPPYALPKTAPENLRLLRLAPNRGPGLSKAAGLGAAACPVILSVDCDIRLPEGWLAAAFALLHRPGVGLVGGSVASDAGEDSVSRYLRLADHHRRPAGPADFVTGAAWLLPRTVWEAVGGFGDYAARTHEDHFFCGRLRRAGYEIMVCGAGELRQVRRLSRAAMLRRFRAWREDAQREQMAGRADIRALAVHLGATGLQRLEHLLATAGPDPAFAYLELLLSVYTWDYICAFRPAEAAAARAGLAAALADVLAGLPRVRKLLAQDLGFAAPGLPAAGPWPEFWAMLLEPWRAVLTSALGRELETAGVARLIAEDRALRPDFSFYGELDHA